MEYFFGVHIVFQKRKSALTRYNTIAQCLELFAFSY
jgi:hypothetical protein